MCVIVVKKPTDILTNADFRLFARENTDGWGFVYNDEKGTHAVKGMKLPQLFQAAPVLEGKEAVLHFRLSTHGTKTEENCHPFEVLPGLYFLHNGILPIACSKDKKRSDTWHFAELVLKPMFAAIPSAKLSDYIRSGAFRYLLESAIGATNKVVLFDSFGPVIFNRDKWSEKTGPKGLLMSNGYPYLFSFRDDPFEDTEFPFGANKAKKWRSEDEWQYEAPPLSTLTPDSFIDFLEEMPEHRLCDPSWLFENDITPGMIEDFVSFYPAESAKLLAKLAEEYQTYVQYYYE